MLLDDDKNGKDAKENYINEFCLDEKDIFLRSDINEECKLIEDIYSEQDKHNIFNSVLIDHTKQKTHEKNEKNKLKIYISAILQNPENLKEIELQANTKNKIFNRLQNH